MAYKTALLIILSYILFNLEVAVKKVYTIVIQFSNVNSAYFTSTFLIISCYKTFLFLNK